MIKIYYHVYGIDNVEEIVDEQLILLNEIIWNYLSNIVSINKLLVNCCDPIIWLILWCSGGVIAFSICSFVAEGLRPIIGGFLTVVVVVVIFFGLLMLLVSIIPYPGSLEQGRPRFFGDPG